MIDLYNNTIDIRYMNKIIRFATQRFPEKADDIFDSISKNQFISKKELLTTLLESGILTKDLSVTIIGSWYGSILIPVLAPLVKDIVCFDIDEEVGRIATSLHLEEYDNVTHSSQDLTKQRIKTQNDIKNLLVINTSCEHMSDMIDILKLQYTNPKYASKPENLWIACQSNNMTWIDGHTNCVTSMNEFKLQMPMNMEVIKEIEIGEERGIRYFLFGKVPHRKGTNE